jgi:hypothetical protein
MKTYSTVCKKSFSKLDSRGDYYPFIKNRKYECEELNLDYFCLLINCHHQKGVFCRIFDSEFKEFFFTDSELRKYKLKKINEISKI